MLPEAALFVMAEQMLVEVLGRVRPEDEDIVLPPMHGRAPQPMSIAAAVASHLHDEAVLAAVLAGDACRPAPPDGDAGRAAHAACASAGAVEDGDRVVDTPHGELPVRTFLVRSTVERSLLAHYVAAYLGSTARPLPEELARPLWELTAPDAELWRRAGYFRDPLELPDHVSWRDRFLLTAGHQPHPLGH